jgi:16S rRNA C1402 (ribose-2'-O) methylase RsmI
LGEFVFIVEKNQNTQVVISYEEIWKNFSHIHIKDLAKITAYFTDLSSTSVYENLIKTKEKREENL